MIKVTLDTNCIISYLDATDQKRYSEMSRIFELHESKQIEVAVTTRIINDKVRDLDLERRKRDLQFAFRLKVIPGIFRLGSSYLHSKDVGIGDVMLSRKELEAVDEVERHLREILVGESDVSGTDEELERKFGSDFDHIIAHWFNKRDVFLTYDKPIFTKADQLYERIGIKVLSPAEFLRKYPSLDGTAFFADKGEGESNT